MKRIVVVLLLIVVIFGVYVVDFDKVVGVILDMLEYIYEVDEDGDYKLVFDVEDGCSQLVYVCLVVEEFGSYKICEIWLLGYIFLGKQFLVVVVNCLFEDFQDVKLGGWVKQGEFVMFVVKVDVNVLFDVLSDVIDVVICIVDVMEKEFIKKDDY